MDKDHAEKIMAEVARRYDAVSETFSDSRKDPWSELDHLFDGLRAGDRVLDIGCGNGRSCERMVPGVDYVGVDNSERLIEIAKKSYPDCDFMVADALNLPFPGRDFDRVYAIGLLHHIPSERKRTDLLHEIRRVLNPGGTVALTVWDIWEKTARRKRVVKEAILSILGLSKLDVGDVLLSWQGFDDFYFHCFSLGGLVGRCERAGLEIVSIGRAPSKGGTNIYVVARKPDLTKGGVKTTI